MSHMSLMEAILGIFLAFSHPEHPPAVQVKVPDEPTETPLLQTPAPVVSPQPQRRPNATASCSAVQGSQGNPAIVEAVLQAGGAGIEGSVVFAFEMNHGSNRTRQRQADTVHLAPGQTARATTEISVNGHSNANVSVTLPNGQVLRCN